MCKKKQCLLICQTGEKNVTILQPLFLATKELCRRHVPTLSMVWPILYSIEGFFKNYISSRIGEQGSGIRLARALLKSVTARFHYIRDSRSHLIASTLDPRFNPLEWRESCRNYPCLVELSMHYLSIPATTVANERLFKSRTYHFHTIPELAIKPCRETCFPT
ncbi:hypothetical protein PR048_013945 [Dryococelus australis]|uniref:HAT C-terminal dimerisation domain-containing protein n=1 Tax=Dryococelus australis TaxID=614101 RepID=A0ABQ9HTN1_9NEOP|nr:hypothetical protein PR048_013945 [Dryococelus australis]